VPIFVLLKSLARWD